MIVHVDIALGFDREVEEAVVRKQGEHVVEKRNSGLNRGGTCAIDGEGEHNVGLGGLAGDRCYAV